VIVECDSVSKQFPGRLAVDGLNLEVPSGICFGVLGPNGAGKTTTLKMIYGVTAPTAGSIRGFETDVTANPRFVRARLGVTLQENAFIEELSPLENLRVFGRFHLLSKSAIEERAQELLDFLGLRSHATTPVSVLSGGFKRRLGIALSLMNRPELLILDEPTTGLDPAVRQALWQRVRDLRAAGTTVLLTTHYMEEAERCHRLAILDRGVKVADGTPQELQAATGMHIVEVIADDPYAAQAAVNGNPEIASVTQLGVRLRVLIPDRYEKPVEIVNNALASKNVSGDTHSATPTLEDVFVAVTMLPEELGQ